MDEGHVSVDGAKTAGLLTASRYRVTFIAKQALDLPSYLGSTIRGAFGHAFRAVACPSRIDEPCPIPSQCPYHLIFETSPPPGSDALRTHDEVPRPFVISPADSQWHRLQPVEEARQLFQPGDEVAFELVLIGRAQEFFPYFVVALREVNRIGRARQAVELRRIEDITPIAGSFASREGKSSDCHPERRLPESKDLREAISFPAPLPVYDSHENLVRPCNRTLTLNDCATIPRPYGPITIEFLTQTRLKHEGRFVRTPEFQILFRRLLGRLSSLSRFHCGAPLDVDFRGLIDRAASIRLTHDDTKWTRWQRYSSRQERRMEWEGIVGRTTYDGDFTPFWKFLKFGEFVHVGHGATFGLGKFQLTG